MKAVPSTLDPCEWPPLRPLEVQSSPPKRDRRLKATGPDGHEHPILPPPEKPAEITGKITAVAMTGKRALLEAKLIDATPDDTVVTLKVKIEALLGIPLDQQQLVSMAAKMQLQDGWTLVDCGIFCKGDRVLVIRRLRGGALAGSFPLLTFPLLTCPPPPSLRLSLLQGSEGQAKLFPGIVQPTVPRTQPRRANCVSSLTHACPNGRCHRGGSQHSEVHALCGSFGSCA